jgi:hypothetical protein
MRYFIRLTVNLILTLAFVFFIDWITKDKIEQLMAMAFVILFELRNMDDKINDLLEKS